MFESLQEGIGSAIRTLRGRGSLTESNMRDGLALVQRALLEADVSVSVAKDSTVSRVMANLRLSMPIPGFSSC